MKITFLGTRGYIDIKSRGHKWHTATLVSYKHTHLLIDAGIDWRTRLSTLNATAIAITHAHPDHAWALQDGSSVPVYASKETWNIIEEYPIATELRHIVTPGKKYHIGSLTLEPFTEEHSIRCPAVGYRITGGTKAIYHAGDVISINKRHKALHGCDLYIGDGASITRPIIRKKDDQLFGHTTIRAQLSWCEKEGVPRAIFTHFGSQIVRGDERVLGAEIRRLGKERGVEVELAHDGMVVEV